MARLAIESSSVGRIQRDLVVISIRVADLLVGQLLGLARLLQQARHHFRIERVAVSACRPQAFGASVSFHSSAVSPTLALVYIFSPTFIDFKRELVFALRQQSRERAEIKITFQREIFLGAVDVAADVERWP